MGAFLFYLLKSGCCLVVFYIFFKLLMSRSTFFRFNRITLLVGLLGWYFASTYRADNYRGDFFAYSVVCHSRDIAKYGVCHSKSGTDGRSYSYI